MTLADRALLLAESDADAAPRALAGLTPEQRERLLDAHRLVAGGEAYGAMVRALSAEELASYCEGSLAAADAARVEQICWQSPAQLAELFSVARMVGAPTASEVSQALEARLLDLIPEQMQSQASDVGLKYRLAPREPLKVNGKPLAPEHHAERDAYDVERNGTPVTLPGASLLPAKRQEAARTERIWLLAAAAVLFAMVLSGGVGWMAANWPALKSGVPVAQQPTEVPETPQVLDKTSIANQAEQVVPDQDSEGRPAKTQPDSRIEAKREIVVDRAPSPSTPPAPLPDRESNAEERVAAAPPLRHKPPVLVTAPELSISSPQGVMLSDVGLRGTWRMARKKHDLAEPVRMLSLAESWTSVELPGVGTLIFEGDAEAALSMLADGTVEVRMSYGLLGIENLRAGAKLRLVTGDAACTARGASERSTLAMIRDPIGSGLLVPQGALTVDNSEIREGQVIRWQGGMLQPAQPLVPTEQGSLGTPLPPAINPWDLAWLTPPNEFSQDQWRTNFGPLAERLAAADDAGAELIKLADDLREPRQAALAARWSVAANPSTRGMRTWNMLTDRRAAVRTAAVKCLLEAPTSDERGSELRALLRENLGDAVADRIDKWLATAWQPGMPPAAQASEIVEHLQHAKLAVRQIAVSMLELHTVGMLAQMGARPPAYDPTARPAARAAGYAEWKVVLVQLYSPNRKIPAQPNAVQPQRQRALQNGAGGGT
jgi:hypothetical protein